MTKFTKLKNKIKKKGFEEDKHRAVAEVKGEKKYIAKKRKKKLEDFFGIFNSGAYKGYKTRDELYEDRIRQIMGD